MYNGSCWKANLHEDQFFPMILHRHPLGNLAISGQAIPGIGADVEPLAGGDFCICICITYREKGKGSSKPNKIGMDIYLYYIQMKISTPASTIMRSSSSRHTLLQPSRTCAGRSMRNRRRREGLAKLLVRARRVAVGLYYLWGVNQV